MHIHRIYNVQEDEKVLVYQEASNAEGKILQSADYLDDPPLVSAFTYNEKGQLIYQKDQQQGFPFTAQSFAYAEDGKIVGEKLYFGEELCEEMVLEILPDGFIRRQFQDGIEVERLENITDGDNWKSRFYRDSDLLETQEYVYDPAACCGTKYVHSHEEDEKYRIVKYFNGQDDLIKKEEYGTNDDRISIQEFEFVEGLLIEEKAQNFAFQDAYTNVYAYDAHNRLIKFECRSNRGQLLSFRSLQYDLEGRISEEAGLNNHSYPSPPGFHQRFDRYHFVHEYSEGEFIV